MSFIQKMNYPLAIFIGLSAALFNSYSFAENTKLINYTYVGELTKDAAKLALEAMPPLNTLNPSNTAQLYKITYKTTTVSGSESIASGLIALPNQKKENLAIISYFHGTRVNRNDAPSQFAKNYYIYPAVFTNTGGYMLVMPDYLGLGDSNVALHPYIHANTLASTSIDMITAAKEFAQSTHVNLNGKLYLAGNSEGGFTTMVTYESLLKNHPELSVTAAAPGSAPYDWQETIPYLTTQPGPRAALYAAFFFYSMQTYFHYWSGLNVIFKAPYDQLVPNLFDGAHDGNQIQAALPVNPKDLLTEDFFAAMVNGTDKNVNALMKNFNHYDFVSTAPLLLVGSKGDHDVPFHGAELAYDVLKQKSDKVILKSVSDVFDHLQAFPSVVKEQLDFFKKYD